MKRFLITALLLLVISISGCLDKPEDYPVEFDYEPVPTPATFNDALRYMEDYSADKRSVGMWAVLNYPDEAIDAVPLLIQNLYYETSPYVRENAAGVLGLLGEEAISAVPDLITVAKNDKSINVQISVSIALGRIASPKAIPTLANNLYDEYNDLSVPSARAIAAITGESFPDAEFQHGYRLDEDGHPLIVLVAQKWWEDEGQFKNWENE